MIGKNINEKLIFRLIQANRQQALTSAVRSTLNKQFNAASERTEWSI